MRRASAIHEPLSYARVRDGRLLPGLATEQNDYQMRIKKDKRRLDNEASAKAADITSLQVPKPDWFADSERRARRFVRSIGLHAAKGTAIALVGPANFQEFDYVMGEGSSEDGVVGIFDRAVGVIIPEQAAYRYRNSRGSHGLVQLMVHELTHAACSRALYSHTVLHDADTGHEDGFLSRDGLVLGLSGQHGLIEIGSFLNEALAVHAEGLYVRTQLLHDVPPLNSITYLPARGKPKFYDYYEPAYIDKANSIPGYEAYSMEMLSWKAHEMKLTPTPDDLLLALYHTASLDKSLQLHSLRAMPRIINKIQPGLYADMRSTQYDLDGFRDMMKRVYDIVGE